MANRTKRKPDKETTFLSALAKGSSVAAACAAAGVGRATVYEWRKANQAFADAWDHAIEDGTDALEDAAVKRALGGSDTLLIFMLKARRPGKYRDNVALNISGKLTLEQIIGESFEPAKPPAS